MKNLKEKQLLVNLAKTLGQKADDEIINELREFDRIKKQAKASVNKDPMAYILEAAQKLNEEPKKDTPEFPLPPSLDELEEMLKDVPELTPEERVEEHIPEIIDESEKQPEESLIEKSVKFISEAPKDSYQQPDPPKTAPDIQAIVNKLKYLEQWMGKVAMAGPGSGETKFRFLDDIDRDSIGNTDQILRYRPASPTEYGKFFFGQLSGDQGPIRSMQYDTNGPGPNANITAGLVAWNSVEDCLNITQGDGSTLQVGLENYIRVYNNTPNTFANGTFIEFTGVDAEGDAPTFRPYVNNANAAPLYSVGVLTVDIASNTHGRATVLGLVRDIDTTGNTVGETWAPGDILWASPSYPGNYTKFKPTAPNIALSVAAVTTVGETDGIILVRPTIWPRLRYGDFYSTRRQVAAAPNQDTKVTIGQALISSGFSLSGNTIVAADSGLYKFQSRLQLTSSSSSSKSIIVWYKRNGVNIPYSSVRQSVAENGGYRTITNFQVISMNAGDNVSVHFTVTDTTLSIDSPPVFDGAPLIPSIQIAVTEAAL